ncbi:hypothetical protein PIROE2DRAFT_6403 [Piromyces sp. E2]|nr:hypothetical protein PIROE2DRAFT_6403 [Piromyces sp. E2]|eukprot:OUM66361.1 hypothetical protein PIROE2DRAFT_6403 [Piromyces sp. E2]
MKLISPFVLLLSLGIVSSKKAEEDVPEANNLPRFNIPSGFYDQETIEVEIIKPDPNAIVYYTLDGSLPTVNSTVYETPFTLKNKSNEENVYSVVEKVSATYSYVPTKKVNKANIIRTMAKLPDGTLTNVVSGTYFVGLNKKKLYGDLPVVSLITDPENLFGYENGIYVLGKHYDEWISIPENKNKEHYQIEGNYSGKGKESERPVTMEYIPAKQNIVDFSQDLGIRIKGKATRTYNQKSFRLASREEYGKKNIKYELIPGNMRSDGKGVVSKYKTFVLRNGGNDSHFTKLRDRTLQYLIENKLFETQQSDYVIVFIDGEYWGIYSIYEEYDDHYIANNYDIDNKNVVVVKSGNNLEAGTEEDFKQHEADLKFIRKTDMSVPANYSKATEIIDMDGVCWFGAILAFIECKDGWYYGGNFSMWRAREPVSSVPKADGKLRIMTFDTEFSMGLYNNDYSKYDNDVFAELYSTTSYIPTTTGSSIILSLIKNPEFKNMFLTTLCDVQNIIFDEKDLNRLIEESSSVLLPLMKENNERFGFPREFEGMDITFTPEEHFKNEINILTTWVKNRKTVFLKQIANAFGLKPAVKITVSSNDFRKGGFSINKGYEFNGKVFNKKFNGEYFTENIVYITGKASKGRKLKSWTVKNCKVANKKKNTLGIYPKKGCKVTANFK